MVHRERGNSGPARVVVVAAERTQPQAPSNDSTESTELKDIAEIVGHNEPAT